MQARPKLWTILVLIGSLVIPAFGRAAERAASSLPLTQSLTFRASFDHGLDADVAKGDKRLHTILNQNPFEARVGLHAADMTRLAPGQGLTGDALQFTHRESRWLFYPAEENVPYNTTNWSGTVSMWLRLDPEEDLAPGYCDPIQISPRAWNDAAFFVDFDKAGDPRDFRLGVFPDMKAWNPEGKSMNDLPEEVRPLLKVKNPPFSRDRWTHVAFTWNNFNTGQKNGVAIFYLDGESQGELTGWNQTHTWTGQPSRLMVGLNYIGLFDELACFDRALTAAEIRQLFAARGKLE